jgi:predicted dehydrogenase
MQNSSRREFLKTSSAALAGAAIAVPAIARAAAGPNDRIRVAVVGLGYRGFAYAESNHCKSLLELADENVEIAAVCDCDESRLGAAAAYIEKQSGKRPATFVDERKLLEDKTIDAVSLATPDHWHALETIWACQAGKDVYVEKPGSHNLFEGRKMVEAARKHQRIVQHGTQCRSSEKIHEGMQKLKAGVIGRIYMARGISFKIRAGGRNQFGPAPKGLHWDLWLGPAPETPFNQLAFHRWQSLKAYGSGEIGTQGVHQLDMIRWGLGLDAHPTKVQSMGGNFVHADDTDTPSHQLFACEYEGRRLLVQFETRQWYSNSEAGMGIEYPFVDHRNAVGVIFFGTEGYMMIPDYSSYHVFLGKNRTPGPSASLPGNPMMDTGHFRNWIAAMRSRKPGDLRADIEEGHRSTALVHLANVAYRTGRTLSFDPQTERFLNDPEADKLLTRPYRPPYVVPDEV